MDRFASHLERGATESIVTNFVLMHLGGFDYIQTGVAVNTVPLLLCSL